MLQITLRPLTRLKFLFFNRKTAKSQVGFLTVMLEHSIKERKKVNVLI